MSFRSRNNQIRVKVIKLKRSFDLEIRQNHSFALKSQNRRNFSTVRPYQFPDCSEKGPVKDNDSLADAPPKMPKANEQKPLNVPHDTATNHSKTKKFGNFSYKSQKTQRFLKEQLAIEDFKHIRSISINNFTQSTDKAAKLKSQAEKMLQMFNSRIYPSYQTAKSHLNANQNLRSNFTDTLKSKQVSLKPFQKMRIKSEQSRNMPPPSISYTLSSIIHGGKEMNQSKLNNKRFVIDPWEVSEDFIT